MYLFRALNENDIKEYNDNKIIHCTYFNKDLQNYKKFYLYDNEFDRIKNPLDSIIGHVNGMSLSIYKSPWISASKDLNLVMKEYAMPQNNRFSISKRRKSVAVIKTDEIYSDSKVLKDLLFYTYKNQSKATDTPFIVDVSDERLENYFLTEWINRDEYKKDNNHIVDRKRDNSLLTYTQNVRDVAKLFNERKLKGLSDFSKKASEVLINERISNDDIVIILSPLLQDIIYALDETDINAIINNLNTYDNLVSIAYNNTFTQFERQIFDFLYSRENKEVYHTPTCLYTSSIRYNNLIDQIDLEKAPFCDIVGQYNVLKGVKRKILKKILNPYNIQDIKLLDDYVDVGIIDPENANKFDVNDLILLQYDTEHVLSTDYFSKSKLKKLGIRTK